MQSAGNEFYGQINIATDAGGNSRLAIHPPAFGGSAETFTILNNGNVFIGTTSQISSALLSVNGSIATAAPAGGTAAAVKFGVFHAGVPTGTAGWLEEDHNGTLYKIPCVY